MPRRTKSEKPYIVVFCEGESEQVYTDFLKKEFRDVASIKRTKATGLFEEADNKFKKDNSYRDYAEVTDENTGLCYIMECIRHRFKQFPKRTVLWRDYWQKSRTIRKEALL